ncbi:exported hypothetical protein [Candidatus Sulfotelmatobacter sp. SbA7]|nr:exported hypothetical protein [Candidatus Sulfotelmatobacter sp. SbA7]
MLACGLRTVTRLLSFVLAIAPLTFGQQSPQQQQSPDRNVAKELSTDLAEVNALVQSLAAPMTASAAPKANGTTGTRSTHESVFYFPKSYEGKAQPLPDAEKTATFASGDKANLVQWSDDGKWALAVDTEGKTGWVDLAGYFRRRFEQVMPQVIADLQDMKTKYQQGPIRITGFSVDLVPPNVSVQFEFK